MLSRVANNCLWLGRYLERAENTARLVGAVNVVAGVVEVEPDLSTDDARFDPWLEALKCGADLGAYKELGKPIQAASTAPYMLVDRANPSSVVSCMRSAGGNARTARHLLGDSYWEAVNTAWIEADDFDADDVVAVGIEAIVEWAIDRCRLIRGTADDLMRDELPHVIEAGICIERVDFVARLLGVMLPATLDRRHPAVASTAHQRIDTLMNAAGARETFRRVSPDRGSTADAVELLTSLNACPRSLARNLALLERSLTGFTAGGTCAAIVLVAELRDKLGEAASGRFAGDWKTVLGEIHLGIGAVAATVERDHLSVPSAQTQMQRQSEG